MGLLDKIQIWPSTHPHTEVTTTTIRSSIVDMEGAEGCLFIWSYSSGSTTLTGMRVLGSSANSTAAMIHLKSAGTTQASTAIIDPATGNLGASLNQKVLAIDVFKPVAKRYVMAAADGSSNIHGVVALKYDLRRKGSTETKDSTNLNTLVSVIGAATS